MVLQYNQVSIDTKVCHHAFGTLLMVHMDLVGMDHVVLLVVQVLQELLDNFGRDHLLSTNV